VSNLKNPSNFVHLHVHYETSLLDGINRIDTLPEHVKSLGQTALSQTDHGNVSGSYRFFKACNKAGIKPIIGMEAYYSVEDRTVREADDLEQAYYHLILIALNNEGLHNLFKLSSYAYTTGLYRKPRLDDDLLGQYNKGICATSACLGSRASQLILRGRNQEAEKLIHHHAALFSNRFLIELQLHDDPEQQLVNRVLMDIAKRNDYPMVLSNDGHYTHEADKYLHEAALCMQTRSVLSDEKRFTFGEIDVHVAHHDWMWHRADMQGIPYESITNTVAVADMVDADSYFEDRINRYPKFQGLPPELTSDNALERVAKEGLYNRFGEMPPTEYRERLDSELKAIKIMGFSDYMLIVWELLNGARSEGVLTGPGRGSAAGSLVAYALRITEVDPIEYGLIFERFLNKGRSATPKLFTRQMLDQILDKDENSTFEEIEEAVG